ncbi:DMT family transporter [Xanthobacter autotrophicus DSM 431]|uniref:DMT family transporter n=1 Tax=Xanthobacter nonsaccharivorans TaxID=3119912 RepID=UPI00372A8009
MPVVRSSADAPFGATDALLYVATILIFGTGWLPLKLQLGVVAPEVSGVWRFLMATGAMFALVVATRGRLAFGVRDHVLFAAMGVTLFSLNFVSFYYAGYHLPSGLLSVVFALSAVIIPFLSAAVLGRPVRRRVFIGGAAGVAGLGLVFGPAIAEGNGVDGVGAGLGLALAGTLCFSLGSLFSGIAARRGYPLTSLTAWGFFYGLVVLAAIALVRGSPFIVEWNARYLGSLAFLVLAQTLSGFAIYLMLIRRIGASRAGYGTVLFPLVALAISTWFEAFHWTLSAAGGIALVLAGTLLVLMPDRVGRGRP